MSATPVMVPFYGEHQAGITTRQKAHVSFVGLDLLPGTDSRDLAGVLAMLTDDAARLCSGRPPLGALEASSAAAVAGLTVTFGFGPGLFAAAGVAQRCPEGVRSLPAFATDRLDRRWGQTDLLLQLCSDDPTGLAYAQRRLLRDAAHVCELRWVQRGFATTGHEPGEPDDASPRNLLGMRDGSANERDPAQVASVAWCAGPGPMAGGTQLVLRRIRLDLERWDDVDTAAKEMAFGRRVADGSPLSSPAGTSEFTVVDRTASDDQGFTVVPPNSHAARAQARSGSERMLRRGYNYDDGPGADGQRDAGQLFAAYQADIGAAFVPVQRRLAQADALNTWSTHVGSAVYAVPPGAAPGEWVGQALLT
ncbi:dye decolorizing peroxidase [Kineosphaera limosa]|uniref:Putative peroxidase n=1 Tax=Kineosphaera limosa NBRC 100340 TaxID=1184609 RepID=K6W6A8_9MICO|nr:Dyp-type peroxidase [Kineosphaera limosa]NYD99323.1 dye decolorizing peroxidase [Kineosphaera limosa]GAB94720.1 putative peroxidase [Kineosphaera limosa NBRC 100340]